MDPSIPAPSAEDASQPATQMRQPKKRFVGRRTADAQAQKDTTSQKDVESTAVQTGTYLTLAQLRSIY
jgi:2-(3-amino-3-carboxypropyl)histidine synthase